jgi:hypothetical protein
VAGRDGQDVGGLFAFEAVPAVAGHDGGLAGEESDHVVGIRLVGAEMETNRAAQAAHRLVGERVLLPVSAWTSSSVLAWKIANRHSAPSSANRRSSARIVSRDSKWES